MAAVVGLILLEDEPYEVTLCAWAGWMVIMILITLVVIYVSDYFNRTRHCSGHKSGNHSHHSHETEGMLVRKPYSHVVQVKGPSESLNDGWDYLDSIGYKSDSPRAKPHFGDHYYLIGHRY
jgi:hypothetical protein